MPDPTEYFFGMLVIVTRRSLPNRRFRMVSNRRLSASLISPVSVASLVFLFASLATAGGNNNALKLEYVLSGPAINGLVPQGKATINQPSLPGTLTTEVQNVNLPDGTVLKVRVNFYVAGTLTIAGHGGRMTASIPFQVRTGPFEILNGDTVIMTGRWKT
jgi:hypothetical protein